MSSFNQYIIYHDDDIIMVEKPSLLLSVPGRGIEKLDSVTTRLQALFNEVHIVHRLDWETSGLMVFAKNKSSQKALNIQFMNRLVKKQYQAIIFGHLQGKGFIDFPLIADWERRPKQKVDYHRGKQSLTYWELIAQGKTKNKNISHIRLSPVTGRSHQLRVHLAALSHPILGDPLYAQPMAVQMANRLQLHASFLSFSHPRTDKKISFKSTCPFSLSDFDNLD
ncbi:MAG: pseudouridine synthase [Pseudomonadota bacterium]